LEFLGSRPWQEPPALIPGVAKKMLPNGVKPGVA